MKQQVLLGLLIGLLTVEIAWARSETGPCQFRDGICYQALYERLTAEEARALKSPPVSPLQAIRHACRRAPQSGPLGLDDPPRALVRVEQPWLDDFQRTIVKIDASFPDQPAGTLMVCSGTMIGRHTVLTAGHCIYSHDYGGWAEWTRVYPAMANYHMTPYGQANGANLTSTNWWVDDQNHDGDIGIIQLAENSGDLTGWPAIVWEYSSWSGAVRSGGYPADEGYDGYWMYVDSDSLDELTDYLVCHDAHTVAGMSGGAVWREDSGSPELTGANSFCLLESPYTCCGARYGDLTDQMRENSEAETAGPAPDHWTCDLGQFSDLDGCHCNCGLLDPDCGQPGQTVIGCAAGERCIAPGVCICDPQCDGRYCGPDGCGSVCGTCPGGAVCQDGLCECVPDCSGRNCGSDGCGSICGTCPAGTECTGGHCTCAPLCSGRRCGPDGCGGSCGTCPGGEICQDGICYCLPDCTSRQCGPDGCGGDCGGCAGDQECVNGMCICTDNCQGRECGSDGCGGSCGSCVAGTFCVEGQCREEAGGSDGCGCGLSGSGAWQVSLLVLLGLAGFRRRRSV